MGGLAKSPLAGLAALGLGGLGPANTTGLNPAGITTIITWPSLKSFTTCVYLVLTHSQQGTLTLVIIYNYTNPVYYFA